MLALIETALGGGGDGGVSDFEKSGVPQFQNLAATVRLKIERQNNFRVRMIMKYMDIVATLLFVNV